MNRPAVFLGLAAAVLAALTAASPAAAQTSKSAIVGKELADVLDSKKLDAIAVKDLADPERYDAALYFPGAQLLVVSGKYSVPQLMDARLAKKEYRDVYTELNGTAAPDSKIFVLDMGAPGLTAKKSEGFDSWTEGTKRYVFDGDWDAQKLSEAEYTKAFAASDEVYAKILGALLAEAKK